MQNNKTISIVLAIISLIVLGLIVYFFTGKNKELLLEPKPTALNTSIVYSNNDFGFTLSLPESWKGYSVVKSTWEGNPLTATGTKQTGVKLLLRNPKWTPALPYEDIPVMIFTVS